MLRGHRVQRVDLVLQHRRGEVAVDGALELRAEPRGAPPVDDDHGETLVGEPLAGEVRVARGDHALGVRAAVGVHQHRQPGAGLVAGRQQQRGGQAAVARAAQRDPRDQAGRLGVRRHRGDRPARARPSSRRRRRSRSCRATSSVPPRSLPECTPSAGVRAARPSGLHVHSPTDSGVSLARSSTVSPSTSSTLRTCRDGGVTGTPSTTSRRAPSASATVTGAPAAVCAGTPGTMSTQTGSVRSWSSGGVAGGRVDAQRAQRRLVAGLDDDEQAVVVPDDVGEVLLGPADRGPPPVQRDDLGADQRVRRARRRVGDDRRVPVGVRGVGDVPALHRGVVDARDDQGVARGRPPVAAHPLHLLGGDEVGEPVAHLGRRPARRGCGSFPPARSCTCSARPLT